MSLASAGNVDYDVRQNSHLNALRKLFEETRRSPDLQDLNSEELFGQDIRTCAGEVHKEDFVYIILDRDQFTLTRSEANNICELLLQITQ